MAAYRESSDIGEAVAALMREVRDRDIMPYFKNLKPSDTREKAPKDWVTVADELAERSLRSGLLALLPSASAVGEEEVAVNRSAMDRLEDPGPVWLIDPLDGTRLFHDDQEG